MLLHLNTNVLLLLSSTALTSDASCTQSASVTMRLTVRSGMRTVKGPVSTGVAAATCGDPPGLTARAGGDGGGAGGWGGLTGSAGMAGVSTASRLHVGQQSPSSASVIAYAHRPGPASLVQNRSSVLHGCGMSMHTCTPSAESELSDSDVSLSAVALAPSCQ